ncbi:MAG: Type 1 glutamine amidotransferase-like domain-containing protein [Bacillota bacterium]
MKRIIACGGFSGKYSSFDKNSPDFYRIDDLIFNQQPDKKQNVLFVPTAGADGHDVVSERRNYYESNYNCVFDALLLIDKLERPKAQARIEKADIIYVNGGNTLFMVKLWRKLGIDKLLEAAYERGVLISGVSAGANCWHQYANSNAKKAKHPDAPLMRVRCLGWKPFLFCPHYLGEDYRRSGLKDMLRDYGGIALGVDDDTAIEYRNDEWRLLFNGVEGRAWKCFWINNEYQELRLPFDGKFRSLSELTNKLVVIKL